MHKINQTISQKISEYQVQQFLLNWFLFKFDDLHTHPYNIKSLNATSPSEMFEES